MVLFIVKLMLFVGFFVIGLKITHKYIHHSKLEAHNDVAGFIYAVVGVIYAVLIAFVVMNVWEQYMNSERCVNEEVAHVIDVYRNAAAFPEKVKDEMQRSCLKYMNDVVHYDFEAMQDFKISREADASYKHLWKVFLQYTPENKFEWTWYSENVRELNQLADARRYRINSIYQGISWVMWFVLLCGAFITIVFSYLFGTKNRAAHVVMVVILSSTIGLTLLLIQAFEHPFMGLIRVGPDAFVRALEQLTK